MAQLIRVLFTNAFCLNSENVEEAKVLKPEEGHLVETRRDKFNFYSKINTVFYFKSQNGFLTFYKLRFDKICINNSRNLVRQNNIWFFGMESQVVWNGT
ncbi:hypothetical protein BpHYR1_053620 [Brachionus plicatilis]|uniref:Uncharacterized protein n=1 Tax=Brachionus plicatilis TaxID=10195 RepID=A0A3M7PHB4_BRAPC|nr:hypothetical protein BpHYR1_053620 [Brachionus plicatilis]